MLKTGGILGLRQGFGMPAPSFLIQSGFREEEIREWYKFGNVYVDKDSFSESAERNGFSIGEVKDFEDCFVALCEKP